MSISLNDNLNDVLRSIERPSLDVIRPLHSYQLARDGGHDGGHDGGRGGHDGGHDGSRGARCSA